MARLNVLLLMAVIASALWLVRTAYDARRLFAEIHRAEQEGLLLLPKPVDPDLLLHTLTGLCR